MASGLQEIEEHWSISDVFDALDFLDFKEDHQAYERKVAEVEARKNK